MLHQLCISNFAIIKHLEITLRPGLNILSGETGAGKSIIINAMNLILGGRASADLIRSGCKEATVEALFSFPENQVLKEMLKEFGLTFEGELLIKRTIFREGRNKVFINGAMATLQMLSRLGSSLISISGQHEHQLLLKPENHLYLLDDFGGLSPERSELGDMYRRHQSFKDKIRDMEKEIQETGEKQDLSLFQIQEIEGAGLLPGEDELLSQEKSRLQNAEELLEIATEAYQTLYERHDAVLSSVSQCAKRLDRGAEIDHRLGSIRNALEEIEVKLEDASISLRDFQKTIHMDPDRLEGVLERIEQINRLKRKYGPTLQDIKEFRDGLATRMYDLDEKRKGLGELEKQRGILEARLTDMAMELSKKRKKTGKILEKAIENEIQQLNMPGTKFQVSFSEEAHDQKGLDMPEIERIGADGIDQVEFMICPNVGEELRPLAKIASGGELSRLMLAVKTILARTGSIETVIFDEVDSGIGGGTAEVVGNKLLSLAEYHQILCITHLPQIASQGKTHFLVIKEIVNARTQARISELDPESRVQEIARLLGGREITPSAVAHAREMLG